MRVADRIANPARDDRQHLVADPMAVAVVEQAEVVQIDEQQRAALLPGVRVGQNAAGTLVECLSIRELGQFVDRRQPLDAFLRLHLLGDVLADTSIADELAVRAINRVATGDVVDERTIRHPAPKHYVAKRFLREQSGAMLIPRRRPNQLAGQVPAMFADDLVVFQIDRVAFAPLQPGKTQLFVHFPIPVRRQLRQRAKTGFVIRNLRDQQFALGHVPCQTAIAGELAAFEHRMARYFEVHVSAQMLRMQLQFQMLESAPLANVAIQLFPVDRHRRIQPRNLR